MSNSASSVESKRVYSVPGVNTRDSYEHIEAFQYIHLLEASSGDEWVDFTLTTAV